jgi:hypothetical protein
MTLGRIAIQVSPRPCWDLPDGTRPFVFPAPTELLPDVRWLVRYGEEGLRAFPTASAAIEWATRHHADLVRGLCPETGEAR